MKQYFYHVTTEENAKKILKEGLIPQIGKHSMLAGEDMPCIYVSDLKSVPYWSTILNMSVVLQVNVDEDIDENLVRQYYGYNEIRLLQPVMAEQICLSGVNTKLTDEEMQKLLLSYFNSMSKSCVDFARYITYIDTDEDSMYAMYHFISAIERIKLDRYVIEHLDFSLLQNDAALIRKHLRKIETKEHTLCDVYNVDGRKENGLRLYQLLSKNNCAYANNTTDWAYNWLKKTFPRKLRVSTGMYEG